MPTCADIFNSMPERFNAQAAGNWETTILFNVSGEGGGTWSMDVKEGVCTIKEEGIESPKATVNTDAETWVGINTGTVNPMQAFMSGKIKVEGNMGEVMKLSNPAVFRRGSTGQEGAPSAPAG